MPPKTMTTTEAAAALGVNAMTVRRWCAAHAKHLSAGANPPPRGTRKLTGRDVEVLRVAAEMRAERLTASQIDARLGDLTFAEVDDDAQENAQDAPGRYESAREEESTALVRLSVLEAAYSADRELWEEQTAALHARIEELQREIGRLEGQPRKRPAWWAKLFGGDA